MTSSEVHDGGDVEQEAGIQTKMNELKSLRASTKGNITRIKTLISKKGTSLSPEELNCRLGILESYFKQFLGVQANMDKISPISDSASSETITMEIEEAYVSTKSKILSLLANRQTSSMDMSLLNTTSSVAVATRMRREIKLPTFSGKYSDYPKFITLFKKLIHQDETLASCERFLILREHLSSHALATINDFEITDANYPKALDRLEECFDKKTLMFEEHITAIFDISKTTKAPAAHLRNVVNSVNANLNAMLSLGDYKDVTHAMLIHMVMERVDEGTQIKWEEAVDYSKLSSWEECSAILTRRCENLEARESKARPLYAKFTNNQNDFKNKRRNPTSLTVAQVFCKICNGSGHELADCYKFKSLSLKERYGVARQLRVCFICLKKGHWQKNCSAVKCSKCNLAHHQLLHRDCVPEVNVLVSNELPLTSAQGPVRSSVMNVTAEPEVFEATAMVMVKDNCGKYHRARAILDSGSQVNLMCENLLQKLLLKKVSCNMNASDVGEVATVFRKQTVATVKSMINDYEFSLDFYVLPKITSAKPHRYFDISSWNLPKNIPLADPDFNKPAKIDILIGVEMFFDLISVGRISLAKNLPILQKTILGWIIAGKAKEGMVPICRTSNMLVSTIDPQDEDLNHLVKKFWESETVSPRTKFLTAEEKECEEMFKTSIARDIAGRFITTIPP